MYSSQCSRHAFSLVELSIVLVILGLLTGGILAGQSLIRAAEMRSVVTEGDRYRTAAYTFRDKYLQGAGDFSNATSFWGKNASYCNLDPGTANATTGTCNGNGDGIITHSGSVDDSSTENFQFWRHLALSGIIEGNYSGISGTGGYAHVLPGVNSPLSRIKNAGWSVSYSPPNTVGGPQMFLIPDYGNFMIFGTVNGTTGNGGAVITPEEAWNIDTKLDDGRPTYGRVIAKFWNNACTVPNTGVASQTNLDASYNLSNKSVQCMLHFVKVF